MRVRLFESLISLLLGGPSSTEAVGLNSADAITVETDGSLEITDALKTTAPGLGALGLSVHRDSFDTAARDPRVMAARRQFDLLSPTCRTCPVAAVVAAGSTRIASARTAASPIRRSTAATCTG